MGSEQATGVKDRMMDKVRNVEIRVKLKQEGTLEKGKRSQVR